MSRVFLYWIVFLGGAAVLSLEILGTRVIGPYYGVSLFVWSALITVALLALSVGYTLGGRLADRRPHLSGLAWVPGAAGLWTLLIPWIRDPVLIATESLGVRAGVLVSALVLFAVPLTLLGMIGPYAIRLRAERVEEVGRTAGRIYALSTVASVISAILTGFWLTPALGVRRLILLIGGLLVMTSLGAVLAGRGRRAATVAAFLLLPLGAGGMLLGASEGDRVADSVVAFEQSPYGEVRVLDTEEERLLLIDGGVHTRVDATSRRATFRYVVALEPLLRHFPEPGRALVIGLGGGAAARMLAAGGWAVDGVDVDPVVARFAADYFGLQRDEATVVVGDARRFLRETDATYDFVLVDAYGSGSMPFHLCSREFFALVRSRMTPDGILAANVFASAWEDRIVRSVAATLGEQFSEVSALPTQEPPNSVGNVVVAAANRALDLPEDALPHPKDHLDDEYEHWRVVQMNHAWDNRFRPASAGAPVMTDDRNPVELWFEPVHMAARAAVLGSVGRDALLW